MKFRGGEWGGGKRDLGRDIGTRSALVIIYISRAVERQDSRAEILGLVMSAS